MRVVAFLSALSGVVAGLLFGLLLWGGAAEAAAPVVGGKTEVEVEMLGTLRDIRTLLERQPTGVRPALSAEATPAAPAEPQPLTADSTARSVEDFRVALDDAVAALQRVAVDSGSGFAGTTVSPDAIETLKTALAPAGKGKVPDLFGCSPRDVYTTLGRPVAVSMLDGMLTWLYNNDWPSRGRSLRVQFTDGYVSSWYAFDPN